MLEVVYEGGLDRLTADGERGAVNEQVAGAVVAARILQPMFDLAQFRASVDVGAGEEVVDDGGVGCGHGLPRAGERPPARQISVRAFYQ
ncbi:MAG: hypothetical protein EBS01_14315 [Verrucomicrobia bacterium]|nr:hypothetical protein [Verrucomicrobiota bacterium]